MPRYRWNGSELVEITSEESRAPAIQIIRDIPGYKSPLGDGVWVDGRAARREHMKRNGCREVDPSEFKGGYRNPHFAAKRGLKLREE